MQKCLSWAVIGLILSVWMVQTAPDNIADGNFNDEKIPDGLVSLFMKKGTPHWSGMHFLGLKNGVMVVHPESFNPVWSKLHKEKAERFKKFQGAKINLHTNLVKQKIKLTKMQSFILNVYFSACTVSPLLHVEPNPTWKV